MLQARHSEVHVQAGFRTMSTNHFLFQAATTPTEAARHPSPPSRERASQRVAAAWGEDLWWGFKRLVCCHGNSRIPKRTESVCPVGEKKCLMRGKDRVGWAQPAGFGGCWVVIGKHVSVWRGAWACWAASCQGWG